MSNTLADAIRDELREELIRAHGTLDAAATVIGIPYKTLYRALTTRGKDRSQTVKLDLVLDITDHLARSDPRLSFNSIYARAVDRRDRYALVANEAIDERPEGDDAGFDGA
ncbi:MAG: hypothetical protein WA971_05705 [Microbacterium sp.]